jgi:hypothetical protein
LSAYDHSSHAEGRVGNGSRWKNLATDCFGELCAVMHPTAQFLRDEARKCREVANMVSLNVPREELLEMARRHEEKAEQIEASASD